jgi:hypothetical protein
MLALEARKTAAAYLSRKRDKVRLGRLAKQIPQVKKRFEQWRRRHGFQKKKNERVWLAGALTDNTAAMVEKSLRTGCTGLPFAMTAASQPAGSQNERLTTDYRQCLTIRQP